LDEKLLLLINREWTSPVLDKIMAAASSLDAWLPLFVVLILLVLWRGGFRARAFLVMLTLIVAVNDGIVSNILKHLVGRPRPNQSHYDVRVVDLAKMRPRCLALFRPVEVRMSLAELGNVEGRSFPSGHTIHTMSAALVAVAFYGARAAWAFALAGLVAYSRIYTGSHWPSDVLTTIPLAFGVTLLLLALANWLWHRHGGRWLPHIRAQHPFLFAS
jgi:undecaprenyl-diphosphatase